MKESLKKRLAEKRKKLAERNAGMGMFFFPKEGKTRIRILPIKDDEDWGLEVTHFYLGPTLKGVFSRASIGEDCPLLEYYNELKASPDPEDREKAKKFPPRKKYLVPAIIYKDEKGKEIDEELGVRLVMLPGSTYGEIIDFFLDPDLGDFTDPEDGYDIKITRTGSGKLDTKYTVMAMRPSALPDKWAKPVDPQELLEKALPSEEDLEKILEEWKAILDSGNSEEDEPREKSPRKKKARKKKSSKGDI